MPRPRKRDIKPDFLRFIDLLYSCRDQEIGKKGITRIKLSELEQKLIGAQQLNEFIARLVEDEVIKPLEVEVEYHMDTNGNFVGGNEDNEIELYSFFTKEQILEYRYSLTGTKDNSVIFRAPSWESVMIKLVDARNLLVTITGTDILDVPVTYGTLGFSNSRNGAPINTWEFFLILAKHNGNIEKRHPDLQRIEGDLDKHKQIVKEKLQIAFGIPDEDPFKPLSRHRRIYELKCTLGSELNLTANLPEVSEEDSPYRQTLEGYQ